MSENRIGVEEREAMERRIETALATNWIAVPFGRPQDKHDSDLPRKLARDLRRLLDD